MATQNGTRKTGPLVASPTGEFDARFHTRAGFGIRVLGGPGHFLEFEGREWLMSLERTGEFEGVLWPLPLLRQFRPGPCPSYDGHGNYAYKTPVGVVKNIGWNEAQRALVGWFFPRNDFILRDLLERQLDSYLPDLSLRAWIEYDTLTCEGRPWCAVKQIKELHCVDLVEMAFGGGRFLTESEIKKIWRLQ